jgi:hypothetical protein
MLINVHELIQVDDYFKSKEFFSIITKKKSITYDSKLSKHFHFHLPMLIQLVHLDYPDRFLPLFDKQQYQNQYLLHQVLMNIQYDNNPIDNPQ